MKKLMTVLLCSLAGLAMFGQNAFAKKTTYIATNQRFNFVKLEELGFKEAEQRAMTHPAELDGEKLRNALAAINLSKLFMVGDKTPESRAVFEEQALNYLVPNLVKAFAQAKANEQVVFSYLQKDPILIFRNDRLTIATAWLQGDVLNLQFNKLYAKVQGDTTQRSNTLRTSAQAKGMRVSLDLIPGQAYAANDPDTFTIDLNVDYLAQKVATPASASTSAVKEKQKPAAMASSAAVSAPAPVLRQAQDERSATERLQTLEELKKDKLITDEEYKAKRQEILNQL